MTGPAAGLRVCGDWSATTGLAHAARRLATALLEAGVDLTVSTFASGAPREPWLFPDELRTLEGGPPRPVGLWTLNINELPQVPDAELSSGSRYNIGTWYFELPTVPEWMQPQFTRISEIWAPTKFVQRAFIRYTDKPVFVVPPVVPVFQADGDIESLRHRLCLPQGRTIFLASFDFNSAVSRKNPLGVVEAFGNAFPEPSASGPFLVLKAINLVPGQPFTRRLVDAVAGVGGMLIDRTVDHQTFANLFHACDVYVSLHRSEGFGLGLAEAMAIGKPAIATAYSGNLDFMSSANSCLVGYRPREIGAADHADNPGIDTTYTGGALWAEPDLDQAARWMSILQSDPEQRGHIGRAGQRTITSSFSAQAVAARAVERLVELYDELGVGPLGRGLPGAGVKRQA
jgi:glycosyltransferase involved in cell wall biosynthesis